MVGRTDARRAPPRTGARPPAGLAPARRRHSDSQRLLVSPAGLDCVRPPSPRVRTSVRRHGARGRNQRRPVRVALAGTGAHVHRGPAICPGCRVRGSLDAGATRARDARGADRSFAASALVWRRTDGGDARPRGDNSGIRRGRRCSGRGLTRTAAAPDAAARRAADGPLEGMADLSGSACGSRRRSRPAARAAPALIHSQTRKDRPMTRITLCVAMIAALAAPAAAQTGRISGVLTDETGAVLPAVEVRALQRDETGETTRSVVTDRT